jgi:hypothetical protein
VKIAGVGQAVSEAGVWKALVELYAGVYRKQSIAFKVPDLRKLKSLQVLHFGNRHLEAVPGFDNLISLRKVVADFQNVVDRPRLLQLSKLGVQDKLSLLEWFANEKLELATRVIAAIENPQDIIVQSARPYGQRAVLKFAQYTGCQAIAGRHTPGTFTNQLQNTF